MAKLNQPKSGRTATRQRKTGRRSPLATFALIAIGLGLTGGVYAAANATPSASADSAAATQQQVEDGEHLFQANCASCHGMNAVGTDAAPSLIGVGAAAVDFQVGTGRMPMAMDGPQAEAKTPQFTDEETKALAAYVASLAPGPGIPDDSLLKGNTDAAAGAELFRINCAMCHNVAGAGGALTEGKFAPSLKETSPVHIYEAMLTGPQNMPVFNDRNITPEQKSEIVSYLTYLQKNPSPGGFALGDLGPVAEGLFLWIFGLGSIVGLAVWITAKSN